MFAIERLDNRLEMGFWDWIKGAVSWVGNVISKVVNLGSAIYSGYQAIRSIISFF